MNSSTTSTPSVLLDTNIVSGLAKGDLPPAEAWAALRVMEMARTSAVTLAGSTVMRDELDKIPRPARAPHDAVYDTLKVLKTSSGVTWVDANTKAVVENPVYARLKAILPHEPDARMIAVGVEHSQRYFMTHDVKSVLRLRAEVESACSILLRRPTELLAELRRSST